MGFYEDIAPFYDYIFPAGEEQIKLLSDIAGDTVAGKPVASSHPTSDHPKKILDLACGTGEYSIKLAHAGHEVWGIDADPEMIRLARLKATENNVPAVFIAADMLELDDALCNYPGAEFDIIFCIGNSIVHLGSTDAIEVMIKRMKMRLAPGGAILLQIINFDRIIQKGITSLPTLTNNEKGLAFQRNYTLDKHTGLIDFETVLTVKQNNGNIRMCNSVKLFPLTSSMLGDILMNAGFELFEFYGDFKNGSYDAGDSFMLVALITGR